MGGSCRLRSNARWQPQLLRVGQKVEDVDFDPPPEEPEAPYIEALDASAPSWTFVDVRVNSSRADLDGVEEISPDRFYLPRDRALTGFEAQMPHLRRADGKAVIFPAGVKDRSFKHDFANTWFVYADEEVFFYFEGYARNFAWCLSLSRFNHPTCVGLRNLQRFDLKQPGGLPSDLFLQWEATICDFSAPKRNPSPALAQRVTTALLDAGLVWDRPAFAVSEVPERILRCGRPNLLGPKELEPQAIERSRNICVEGGYVGGRFKPNYELRQSISNERE